MDENKVICVRCGATWVVNQEKRKLKTLLCASCRMRPAKTIQYGAERCIIWQGDYHPDTDEPYLDGEAFLPGERTCKHKDCVNPNHCVSVIGKQ